MFDIITEMAGRPQPGALLFTVAAVKTEKNRRGGGAWSRVRDLCMPLVPQGSYGDGQQEPRTYVVFLSFQTNA